MAVDLVDDPGKTFGFRRLRLRLRRHRRHGRRKHDTGKQIFRCHITLHHIGGSTPLLPTVMPALSRLPSGNFFAPTIKIFSPGLSEAAVAGANITTATSAGTINVFSPSL